MYLRYLSVCDQNNLLKAASAIGLAWFTANAVSQGLYFQAAYSFLGLGLVFPWEIKCGWKQFARYCKTRGWNANRILGFLIGVFCTSVLFIALVEPAHAQFFNQTEGWLRRSIPGLQNNSLIPLIFNVLRAIFVIYIGINLVQVIQKMQQQEDWQTLARTPLIIVVAATMGDVLAGIVTGGAGGAGGTAGAGGTGGQ
ncbi:MAG: hypothetical protein D6694_09115 [Gammaproteobacteria bacterium]|nr:MAG: hypothetical protein D6694_09115 [Gammaproteobacteria bacterium]